MSMMEFFKECTGAVVKIIHWLDNKVGVGGCSGYNEDYYIFTIFDSTHIHTLGGWERGGPGFSVQLGVALGDTQELVPYNTVYLSYNIPPFGTRVA